MSAPTLARPAPSAVRVALVHGLAESPAVWDAVRPLLPSDAVVEVPEMPWSVDDPRLWSRPPAPGGPDPLAELDADVVVAHSLAANLLLRLLTTGAPRRRPSAVVLVSPFFRPDADQFGWDTIQDLADSFWSLFHERILLRAIGLRDHGLFGDMADRVCERVGPYGALRFLEVLLGTPDLPLHRLTEPCLVLTGRHDHAARPEDGRALAGALPDGRFHLAEQCGHFPMLEDPAGVADAVAGVCDTTSAAFRGGSR